MEEMNQQQGGYNVDLVMCIDATGSMYPFMDNVKKNAISFYEMFVDSMAESGRDVAELRVKVIAYRDYGYTDAKPMEVSDFYSLPDQNDEFKSFINNIQPTKGGDLPESALEAIALAMKSDFTTGGAKRRHAIVVFTDAPALELSARKDCPDYPQGMPADFAELGSWWENGVGSYQPTAGRLVIFAPDTESWNNFQAWNRVWTHPSNAADGLREVDFQEAIDVLVSSFAATPTNLQD